MTLLAFAQGSARLNFGFQPEHFWDKIVDFKLIIKIQDVSNICMKIKEENNLYNEVLFSIYPWCVVIIVYNDKSRNFLKFCYIRENTEIDI